ncbi:MAG: flagellar basal body rod protein FlgC [Pseudomonadota bacterium]
MSLFTIFDIAGSGMSAQSLRLNVTASNIANAETVSSDPAQTYRARHPVFATVLDDARGAAGVKVLDVLQSNAPLRSQYQPDHPQADAQGYVYMPNVNVIEEMANMISASRSYQGNAEVINTSKQLLLRTLALGQ